LSHVYVIRNLHEWNMEMGVWKTDGNVNRWIMMSRIEAA
jgi:hypothetical protein